VPPLKAPEVIGLVKVIVLFSYLVPIILSPLLNFKATLEALSPSADNNSEYIDVPLAVPIRLNVSPVVAPDNVTEPPE